MVGITKKQLPISKDPGSSSHVTKSVTIKKKKKKKDRRLDLGTEGWDNLEDPRIVCRHIHNVRVPSFPGLRLRSETPNVNEEKAKMTERHKLGSPTEPLQEGPSAAWINAVGQGEWPPDLGC